MPEGTQNRPTSALATLLAWCIMTVGFQVFLVRAGAMGPGLVTEQIGWSFAVISAFLMVLVLYKDWDDVGVEQPMRWAHLPMLWLPLLYVVAMLGLAVSLGLPPVSVLIMVMINSLLIAFSEELMFRGILFSGLRRALPLWPAVLAVTALFAAVHVLNLLLGASIVLTGVQVVAAFLNGLLFMAIRLRSGSLWPSILLHALWDFSAFMLLQASPTGGQSGTMPLSTAIWPVLLVLPNGLYALYLMRRKSLISPAKRITPREGQRG